MKNVSPRMSTDRWLSPFEMDPNPPWVSGPVVPEGAFDCPDCQGDGCGYCGLKGWVTTPRTPPTPTPTSTKAPERDPMWRQDTPDMQMAAILQSAWGHATNAKDGTISHEVAVDRLLAHIEELQRLNLCLKGQTRWKD